MSESCPWHATSTPTSAQNIYRLCGWWHNNGMVCHSMPHVNLLMWTIWHGIFTVPKWNWSKIETLSFTLTKIKHGGQIDRSIKLMMVVVLTIYLVFYVFYWLKLYKKRRTCKKKKINGQVGTLSLTFGQSSLWPITFYL